MRRPSPGWSARFVSDRKLHGRDAAGEGLSCAANSGWPPPGRMAGTLMDSAAGTPVARAWPAGRPQEADRRTGVRPGRGAGAGELAVKPTGMLLASFGLSAFRPTSLSQRRER